MDYLPNRIPPGATVRIPRCRLLLLLGVGLAWTSSAFAQDRPATENDAASKGAIRRLGVMVPMRDGVRLSTDLWLPRSAGRSPVILIRTPYMKTVPWLQSADLGEYFAARGYVLAVQDVRGRGDSEGRFGYFFVEGHDGYDAIEWLARQPWSNGRVGMMGASYLGTAQWMAAKERPPHLRCLVSTAAAGRPFDELPYQGGAFLPIMLRWLNNTSGHTEQDPTVPDSVWGALYRRRPLLTLDSVLGRPMAMYQAFLGHPTDDMYWRRIETSEADFRHIDLPVLHVTGWFDNDQPGAMHYWEGMTGYSPAAADQYLLAGPWTHEQTFFGGARKVGEVTLPEEAIIDVRALHLMFFDHYLKQSTGRFPFPRARVFVTGSNRWRDLDGYPPAAVARRRLYLHGGGHANTLHGDGALGWDPPTEESPDRYRYDPGDPAPSEIKGEHLGVDFRPIQERPDVLVYTGSPLTEPLEIIGRVLVHLTASSEALDTDFLARVEDVYPDGRAVKLGPRAVGVIRARFREGYRREKLLLPDAPTAFTIELFDMAHTFLPGHRIRLEVTSSAFPEVAPNPNTGRPVATDRGGQPANQAIWHDRAHASYLDLPVDTSARP